MTDYTKYIPIISAIIGGCVVIYVWRGKRAKDAKDTFGVFIREQIAALPDRGVEAFYSSTKPAIKIAVHRVWHFLSIEQRTRIDRIWKEYDEIPHDQLSKDMERDYLPELYELFGHPFQSPHQTLKYYLDEFYKFSA